MCVNFEGYLFKEGRYWPVGVPALDVFTQGRTRKDAYSMIKEAVELLVDRKGFAVEVVPMTGDRFVLRAKKNECDKYLMAFLLRRQRAKYGLSLSQVASRLKITRHAYAQYEQARSLPSLSKVQDFVAAMSGDNAVFAIDVIDHHRAA
ncbi:MAG: helix-turn-helix domain-containing protein [Pseudomonadota bacterium]